MKYLRHVMKTNLTGHTISWKAWPQEYTWIFWNDSLLEPMAELVFAATSNTPDATIFPRFQTSDGCRESVRRMIAHHHFFAPGSGVIAMLSSQSMPSCHGGIIGAVLDDNCGWIQNVLVLPGMQGRGIGTFLVEKLLLEFLRYDVVNVGLHVTATNAAALKIYLRYGFEITETIEVEPREF